jgi:hypothetical protein
MPLHWASCVFLGMAGCVTEDYFPAQDLVDEPLLTFVQLEYWLSRLKLAP